MKKYIFILLLIGFITPSITYAAWWNPFTWKIFQKKEVVQQIQINNEVEVSTSTVQKEVSSEEKINSLQKQIDDLKSAQSISSPRSVEDNSINKKEAKKVPDSNYNLSFEKDLVNDTIILHEKYAENLAVNIKTLDSKIEKLEEYLALWTRLTSLQQAVNLNGGITQVDDLNKMLLDYYRNQIVITENEITKFENARNALVTMKNKSLLEEIPALKSKKEKVTDVEFKSTLSSLNTYNLSITQVMELFKKRYQDYTNKQQDAFSLVNKTVTGISAYLEEGLTSSASVNGTIDLNRQISLSLPIVCTSSTVFGLTSTICN